MTLDSISVILGQLAHDIEMLCAMEPPLQLRFHLKQCLNPGPLDQ